MSSSPPDQTSDEQLVAAAQKGSSHAMDALFRRYQTRVALWCYRVSEDRELAADLAQEVFLKAFRSLERFKGDSKFSTWLFAIARNHCLNELHARAARPENNTDSALLELAGSYTESFEADLDRTAKSELIAQVFQSDLDDTERAVMKLHYVEEMSLDAVTRLLGLPNLSGAKAFVVSARRKLQAAVARRTSGKEA